MKKLFFFFAAISLVIALTACGSSNTSAPANTTSVDSANAQQLTLHGTDKTFKFDQPEYKVKKGQPVKITLVNDSGVHGVEIKDFNVKLMGSNLSTTFTPDKAGTFVIQCAVPCGAGHANMKANLVVE